MRRSIAIKALFSIVLTAALTSTIAAAEKHEQYNDLPSGWSGEAVINAIDSGLLVGYNGKIFPKKGLTRSQLASVINRMNYALSSSAHSAPDYNDVSREVWYAVDAAAVKYNDFMVGYNDQFFPDKGATREEVFAVLARIMDIPASEDLSALEEFTDFDKISKWAVPELTAMVEKGYMSGFNGKLHPQSIMTREEFAFVMNQFFYLTNDGDPLQFQLRQQTEENS